MSTERKGFKEKMKRIDFEHGSIPSNILNAAIPMLVAQLLSLLYNIIDRIYIARIPHIGTTALGAVGLCFPIIVIITAFSNLFGSGGDRIRAAAHFSQRFAQLVQCGVQCLGQQLEFTVITVAHPLGQVAFGHHPQHIAHFAHHRGAGFRQLVDAATQISGKPLFASHADRCTRWHGNGL